MVLPRQLRRPLIEYALHHGGQPGGGAVSAGQALPGRSGRAGAEGRGEEHPLAVERRIAGDAPMHGVVEGLREVPVGCLGDGLGVGAFDLRPLGWPHAPESGADLRRHPVDVRLVEIQPGLAGGLHAGPVGMAETLSRVGRDALEALPIRPKLGEDGARGFLLHPWLL